MYIVYDYATDTWRTMYANRLFSVCGRYIFENMQDLRNHLKAHRLALRGAQIVTAD